MSNKSKNIIIGFSIAVGLFFLFAIVVGITMVLSNTDVDNRETYSKKNNENVIESSEPTSSNNNTTAEKSISKSNDKGEVNFDNIVFNDNYGMLEMIGEVTSHRETNISFMFTVTLYDESGGILDTLPGVINNLQPGETKTFTTVSTYGGDFDTYKIQIDNAH